jgi:hypothetical protein
LFEHPLNECLVGFGHGSLLELRDHVRFAFPMRLEGYTGDQGQDAGRYRVGLALPEDRRTLHSALNLEGQFSARYCNRKLNATVSWFSTECPSSSAG